MSKIKDYSNKEIIQKYQIKSSKFNVLLTVNVFSKQNSNSVYVNIVRYNKLIGSAKASNGKHNVISAIKYAFDSTCTSLSTKNTDGYDEFAIKKIMYGYMGIDRNSQDNFIFIKS